MPFLVLEAATELGHTWHTRWDSLRVFTSAVPDALSLPGPALTALRLGRVADDAAYVAADASRTAAALHSGQVPGLRGAPAVQAAPPYVGN